MLFHFLHFGRNGLRLPVDMIDSDQRHRSEPHTIRYQLTPNLLSRSQQRKLL